MTKEQFNVRLNPKLRAAAVAVSDVLDYTRDEIAEIALAMLLGAADEVLSAKWQRAQKAAAQLRERQNHAEHGGIAFQFAA